MRQKLAGIAITDHCDVEYAHQMDVKTPILQSVQTAVRLNEAYGAQLQVFRGVELGEALFYPNVATEVLQQCAYDVVIGSVHAARWKTTVPYSHLDFTTMDPLQVTDYLHTYFNDVLETAEMVDFDVLAHLTCPLRYIVLKYGCAADLTPHAAQVEQILKTIIQRDIALEVNTSATCATEVRTLPDMEIVRQYYALGGRKITLASDAHAATRVGCGFENAATQLRRIGFNTAFYYRNRTAVPYALTP